MGEHRNQIGRLPFSGRKLNKNITHTIPVKEHTIGSKEVQFIFSSIKNVNSFEFRYGGGESLGKFVFGYSADTAGQEHFFRPGQFENALRFELLYILEGHSFYG